MNLKALKNKSEKWKLIKHLLSIQELCISIFRLIAKQCYSHFTATNASKTPRSIFHWKHPYRSNSDIPTILISVWTWIRWRSSYAVNDGMGNTIAIFITFTGANLYYGRIISVLSNFDLRCRHLLYLLTFWITTITTATSIYSGNTFQMPICWSNIHNPIPCLAHNRSSYILMQPVLLNVIAYSIAGKKRLNKIVATTRPLTSEFFIIISVNSTLKLFHQAWEWHQTQTCEQWKRSRYCLLQHTLWRHG